ncbi:MAG: permease prefix domain 1-containing protein [Bryobacteraceae bacterium]
MNCGAARNSFSIGAEFEADLQDELRFHLEMKQAESRERGLSADEARSMALRQVGKTTLLKERSRQMWIWGWLEAAAQDTRHVFRMMRRSPGFTLTSGAVAGARAARTRWYAAF